MTKMRKLHFGDKPKEISVIIVLISCIIVLISSLGPEAAQARVGRVAPLLSTG